MSGFFGFAVVFGLAWGLAFGAVAVARTRDAFAPAIDDLHLAVTAAMYEAHARAHAEMTHVHLALALSFDPEVAARLGRIGPVDELRDRLDASLRAEHGDGDVDGVPTPDPQGEAIRSFAVGLRGQEISRTPAEYVTVLLRAMAANPATSPDVHAIFEAFGLTSATWAATAPRRSEAPTDDKPEPGLPYRGKIVEPGDFVVRFWNDDKTTQEMVLGLLTRTFGRTASEARYLMLRTHFMGSAAFGTFAQEEAERLVEVTTSVVREAGFPLRITVERRDRPEPDGFWSRFFR